jgi:hypothetical protein
VDDDEPQPIAKVAIRIDGIRKVCRELLMHG